jgi:cystathionine beta-lyase
MKRDTLTAHAGRDSQRYAGLVNTPVFRGSTVLYPDLKSYEHNEPDNFKSKRYGIHGTPTTFALEEAVARLEGGHAAVALPSGLAAVVAALAPYAKQGAHILVADSVYGPTRKFCEKRLKPFGVEVEYYDPLIGGMISKQIRSNTTAIYCESPGSLTFEMQDLPAIAEAARSQDIPVLADNTWATPYFFRSFDHGVDVSIHAGTKYIVGHADALVGLVVTNEKQWLPVRHAVADYGYCVSPDDCYLALRGLRTIGVRMQHQQKSALKIARWLQTRPEVLRVLYPALEDDPGHALWRRDFDGAASVFGVILHAVPDDTVATMIDALKLFGIGSSWGGFESLCIRANPTTERTATRGNADGPLIRLHIGLEDSEDLIADLAQGLDRMTNSPEANDRL